MGYISNYWMSNVVNNFLAMTMKKGNIHATPVNSKLDNTVLRYKNNINISMPYRNMLLDVPTAI